MGEFTDSYLTRVPFASPKPGRNARRCAGWRCSVHLARPAPCARPRGLSRSEISALSLRPLLDIALRARSAAILCTMRQGLRSCANRPQAGATAAT